ncbi:unnamed protein product [Hydatigera taeniaeformis]|uniref:Secreted protein n=1 Tax=Hydatigena taeniaeformis TaxID=6205 RepID=A0A0R3WSZ6_HYDTA|nr:unnamed protein product [Hydatigera taeniaeformis]
MMPLRVLANILPLHFTSQQHYQHQQWQQRLESKTRGSRETQTLNLTLVQTVIKEAETVLGPVLMLVPMVVVAMEMEVEEEILHTRECAHNGVSALTIIVGFWELSSFQKEQTACSPPTQRFIEVENR